MAGIGFELKKLFNDRSVGGQIRGYLYATMVSSGPMLISIFMLLSLNQLMKLVNASVIDREQISASIMYAFIFAMILVSGPSIIVTRFISDQLYKKDNTQILSSLLGILSICIGASGLIALIFFLLSPLPLIQKYLTYQMFIELVILYLLMLYLAAVRDYKTISLAFAIGINLAIFPGILLYLLGLPVVEAVLASVCLGFMVSIMILLKVLKKSFSMIQSHVYAFSGYFKKMPLLLLTNIFYTMALFSHNIIIWFFSDSSIKIMGTYVFAHSYDVAAFFSVLTILPSTVLFVIKFETAFYDKYAAYIQTINQGGTLKQINKARSSITHVMYRELSSIFITQFIISIILITIGSRIFMPMLNIDTQAIALFPVLCLGFFLTYMTFIVVTILLYFDNQADSCLVMGILWFTTTGFTFLSLLAGENYYGLGFGLGALLSLSIGISRLNITMGKINYFIFCR